MQKFFVAILTTVLMLYAMSAVGQTQTYKKLVGSYWLYGGSLGDPQPPSAKDRKIAFSIEGDAAKELFDAIGPDKYDACTESSGMRMRWRDDQNLLCSRTKEGVYECSFGFDLRTGKSIGGSIC